MLSPDKQEEFFEAASNYGDLEYDCKLTWERRSEETLLVNLLDEDGETTITARVTFQQATYKVRHMMSVDLLDGTGGDVLIMSCIPQAFFAQLYA